MRFVWFYRIGLLLFIFYSYSHLNLIIFLLWFYRVFVRVCVCVCMYRLDQWTARFHSQTWHSFLWARQELTLSYITSRRVYDIMYNVSLSIFLFIGIYIIYKEIGFGGWSVRFLVSSSVRNLLNIVQFK